MAGGGYLRTMWRELCARAVGRSSIVTLVLACAACVALVAPASSSAARAACAEAVLGDWTRGTLDSSHSPECYEAAIDTLPEDLRAYTTAADDITRAAIAASRAANVAAPRQLSSETSSSDQALRSFPTEAVVLVTVLTLIVSGGAAAALLRRRRGE